MLANMKAALGSDLAVVPVTQTSIAIAANPPQMPAHPACTVPKLTGIQVEKIFNGEIRNWRQLSFASDRTVGGDCDQSITRIVRPESSGVTYQFKHYLHAVNPAPLDCSGKEKRTWAQLQAPFGGETPPNEEWPRNAACQGEEGPVTTVAPGPGEGESATLSFVAESPGTITYGSLPEARQWAPKQIVDVHNGATYADPETAEGSANCAAASYAWPAGWEEGVNVDWSQVYGSNPSIGKTAKNAYPICTLSWAIAATDKFSEGAATTVHDYLAFVASEEGGQPAVKSAGYAELPWQMTKAARAAIAQIGSNAEEEEGGEEEGGTGTVLCQVEPEAVEGVLTCPKGEGFNGGKVTGTLYPTQVATFESLEGPEVLIHCPEGRYGGLFNEDGTSSTGIYEFAFGQKEGCTTSFPEEPEATVSFENLPFGASHFDYNAPGYPHAFFTLAKSEGMPFLRIQSSAICIYMPSWLEAQIVNASTENSTPTLMAMVGKWKLTEQSPEGACPTLLSSYMPMTVQMYSEGPPLYIAGK
jgi:ABC-type phosphate transport system substrate-binding protein